MAHPKPSADHLRVSAQHNIDRFRISQMLLFQYSCRKRVLVVAVEYRHRLLHNNRPVIQFLVHEMYSAARDFHAISKSLSSCASSPGNAGNSDRMDIQNPVRKLLHKPRRQQPHITRKADQLNAMLFQRGHNFTIVIFARLAFGRNDQSIEPALGAVAMPGASALFEMTTAMRASEMRPVSMLSAMATKFDPRPEGGYRENALLI